MAIISCSWVNVLTVYSLFSTAVSSTNQVETIKHLLGWDKFEWTALGDSYSSGVGADTYTPNSYRCLRYDHAYPVLMNSDGRLPKGDHKFNNVVCSGANSMEIEDYQLYDEDTFAEPNFQYGNRPKFGNPSMATLSIGDAHLGRPPPRSCEEQKEITWRLLLSPDLSDNIARTIKKVVDKGRQGPIGNKFRLYVTGFPQFFNDNTTECDSVTFARTANPSPDGMDHVKLTREVRKDYNNMSVKLNQEIEKAVKRHESDGVRWVPIDPVMEGHRYCEPGVKEPDQHNDKLWLYHYPYDEPGDTEVMKHLEKGASRVMLGKRQTYADYENQVFDALELRGGLIQKTAFDFFWREVGKRMKVFHPRIPLHERIRDLVLDAYVGDLKGNAGSGGGSTEPSKPNENECHSISGDTWVMSRDQAVDNVKAFCRHTQSKARYNKGSANELELSVSRKGGSDKRPKGAPNCEARFTRAVIDGCDGDDSKYLFAQDFDYGRN
ncbi:esterase [Apiospora hydei]|uniref:Esterase n=1 Tax=Apiospora hydei TaxID=1337664 RepID=A0ABR1XDX4_9PEZI